MEIDEDLAYLIGALHSDGCIYKFYDKKEKFTRIRLMFVVSKKSLPMLQAFRDIFHKKFDRNLNIRNRKNGQFELATSINKIYHIFRDWKRYNLDESIENSPSLFGSYLAGLIDGDGCVKFKNNKDRKINQLMIAISGPEKLFKVKELLETFTSCKVHFYKYKTANCYDTGFYVTYKNLEFMRDFVTPCIRLKYKKNKIEKYFEYYGPAGI